MSLTAIDCLNICSNGHNLWQVPQTIAQMTALGWAGVACLASALAGGLIGACWQWWRLAANVVPQPSESAAVETQLKAEELRLLTKRLTESELRYQSIVEDQTEMVIRFDFHGTLLFSNKSYRDKNNLTAESAVGFNIFSVVHPDHRDRVVEMVQSTDIHNPFILDLMRVVRADGSIDWSEWRGRSLFDEEGNHCGYQAVGRDVTDLVKARNLLEERELQYRSVVEDLREMIFRCDPQGVITFGNAAFARAKELPPDKLVGRHTFERLHPDDVQIAQQAMDAVSFRNPYGHMELRIVRADGAVQLQEWHGRALYDDQQNLLGYQAVGRDITDIRRTEARLQEKEQQLTHLARVSGLGEMVAGISHEINQPLATIANFSSAAGLTLDQDELSDSDKDNLRSWGQRVLEQTERINKIIQRLRRFGRPGTQRESFAISDAATEALLVTAAATRNQVKRRRMLCGGQLPLVNANRIQIEQVLVNLIQNACDAVQTLPMAQRVLAIAAEVRDDCLVVSVTDSGAGVEKADSQKIFENFVTSKSSGMGIGLAISRSIVESHGGNIWAVTDVDCGKFEFSLPIGTPAGDPTGAKIST